MHEVTLILITPPEPLYTAAEAKALNTSLASASDAQVEAWLSAAALDAQNQIERAIGEQTWAWKVWGADSVPTWPSAWRSWPPYFELPLRPLMEVTEISYLDVAGATQIIDPADYVVSGVGDVGRITLAAGASWPALGAYPEPFTIEFVAGYEIVPEPLKQAVLEIAGDLQSSSSSSGGSGDLKSRTIEGLGSETYDVGSSSSSRSAGGYSATVNKLLRPYVVFR
jgi:uncharacterized phiE125 gp8 family phage protein